DIFTAPIEKGPTRNLTHSSGAHDKWPTWSPDGSQIAFISDMSGEEELYLAPQDGSKPAQQITKGGSAMRYQPDWSADGKRIASAIASLPHRSRMSNSTMRRIATRIFTPWRCAKTSSIPSLPKVTKSALVSRPRSRQKQ